MIAHSPLHRSQRAGLPHWALASGDKAKSPQERGMRSARRGQPAPDEPPHPVPVERPALSASPQRAVPQAPHLETERRYCGPVRLPRPVHRRRVSLDFPTRPAAPSATGDPGPSRFLREVCPHMHGVSDRAEPRRVLRWRRVECGLPLLLTASALRSRLSRLNTRPVRSPVNVSPSLLRAPAHDSGPVWVAGPSPCDSFVHNASPV
jgi:hypothetical protein